MPWKGGWGGGGVRKEVREEGNRREVRREGMKKERWKREKECKQQKGGRENGKEGERKQ